MKMSQDLSDELKYGLAFATCAYGTLSLGLDSCKMTIINFKLNITKNQKDIKGDI